MYRVPKENVITFLKVFQKYTYKLLMYFLNISLYIFLMQITETMKIIH